MPIFRILDTSRAMVYSENTATAEAVAPSGNLLDLFGDCRIPRTWNRPLRSVTSISCYQDGRASVVAETRSPHARLRPTMQGCGQREPLVWLNLHLDSYVGTRSDLSAYRLYARQS